MAEKLGYEGTLRYNATPEDFPGATGTVDAVCTSIRSVSPDLSRGEADMTTRANQGQVVTRPGRRTVTLELEFVYDSTDGLQGALETLYHEDTHKVIPLEFLDDTGGSGFLAYFGCYSYTVSQPGGDEPQILTVTVKPSDELTIV